MTGEFSGKLELSRRRLLTIGAAGAAAAMCSPSLALAGTRQGNLEKTLSLVHANTGETLTTAYRYGNSYLSGAIHKISYLLRDIHTGEVKPVDPRLLDILQAIQSRFGTDEPFEVVSGYRSPATNAKLRRTKRGVARNSLHMQGMAVDIRLSKIQPSKIASAARDLNCGGVGCYRRFVHLDSGEVRAWRG